MNESVRRGFWFRGLLVGLTLAALDGRLAAQVAGEEEPITWDSPKMRQIEAEWQSLEETYKKSPERIPGTLGTDKARKLEELRYRLLERRLSDQQLQQLARQAGPMPDRAYTETLISVMGIAFLDVGDRESLVTLLAKRCPTYFGSLNVEFALAYLGYRLEDPVLILGEAYARCEAPQASRNLIAAVRRSFAGRKINGDGDADYVRRALAWYGNNKSRLIVNRDYLVGSPVEADERPPRWYDNRPPRASDQSLFVEKSSAKTLSLEPAASDDSLPMPVLDNAENGSSTTPEDEFAKLEGTWEIVGHAFDGKPAPHRRFQRLRLVFHDHSLQVVDPDRAKVLLEQHVGLDVKQFPLAIDLTWMPADAIEKQQTTTLVYELQELGSAGIYCLSGDALWICDDIGRHRPTSFRTAAGSRNGLMVLRRVDTRVLDLAALAKDETRLAREFSGKFTWRDSGDAQKQLVHLAIDDVARSADGKSLVFSGTSQYLSGPDRHILKVKTRGTIDLASLSVVLSESEPNRDQAAVDGSFEGTISADRKKIQAVWTNRQDGKQGDLILNSLP